MQRRDATLTVAEMLEIGPWVRAGRERAGVGLDQGKGIPRLQLFSRPTRRGMLHVRTAQRSNRILAGRSRRFRLLCSERHGQGYLSVPGRQESDDRNPGSRRFFRRGKLDRQATAHGDRHGDDRLQAGTTGESGNNSCAPRRAQIFRAVHLLSPGPEESKRNRIWWISCSTRPTNVWHVVFCSWRLLARRERHGRSR